MFHDWTPETDSYWRSGLPANARVNVAERDADPSRLRGRLPNRRDDRRLVLGDPTQRHLHTRQGAVVLIAAGLMLGLFIMSASVIAVVIG